MGPAAAPCRAPSPPFPPDPLSPAARRKGGELLRRMPRPRDRTMHVNQARLISALGLALSLITPAAAQEPLRVASPDGRNVVGVATDRGALYYTLSRDGQPVLMRSRLGFVFRGADSLAGGLRITGSTRSSVDESWTQPWGEVARVRDHHHEL